jgi:hypothetical protein
MSTADKVPMISVYQNVLVVYVRGTVDMLLNCLEYAAVIVVIYLFHF